MGLRWLNGHSVTSATGKKQRLIVEFAIENAQVVQRRKEKEEKARVRSQEVLKAREAGELPEKEKKVLAKSTIMRKTRVGMKGKKGRPVPGKPEKSFDRVVTNGGKPGTKGKVEEGPRGTKGSKGGRPEEKSRDSYAKRKEGKVERKVSIIQKKRMMRKAKRQGRA